VLELDNAPNLLLIKEYEKSSTRESNRTAIPTFVSNSVSMPFRTLAIIKTRLDIFAFF